MSHFQDIFVLHFCFIDIEVYVFVIVIILLKVADDLSVHVVTVFFVLIVLYYFQKGGWHRVNICFSTDRGWVLDGVFLIDVSAIVTPFAVLADLVEVMVEVLTVLFALLLLEMTISRCCSSCSTNNSGCHFK